MPYREIFLEGETFVVRVPASAITEWLGSRDRGRYIGYPDRPPDVDTPLLRGWIQHPNETAKFNYLASTVGHQEVFPVYSISCDALGPLSIVVEAKLLVSYNVPQDKYTFRLIVRTLQGESIVDSEIDVDVTEIEEAFDVKIKQFAEAFVGEGAFISTFADFEALQEETLLAEKELKEYYGDSNPRMVH
jgi:hypothetical protein